MLEVSEAEATGTVAQIYADIREVQGLAIVNLIWRRLAVQPDRLEWAWTATRPLYATSEADRHAAHIANSLDLPPATALSPDVLHAVGLSDGEVARIRTMIDTYNAGNGMNLIALSTLLAAVRAPEPPASHGADPAPAQSQAQTRAQTRVQTRVAALAPGPQASTKRAAEPEMPPIPDMATLTPELQTLVHRLNGLGTETGSSPVLATLYRHAAHWPGFLALIWITLAPLDEAGHIRRAIASTRRGARHRGSHLTASLAASATDRAASGAADVIETFVDNAIARMFVIGSMVHHSLLAGERTTGR